MTAGALAVEAEPLSPASTIESAQAPAAGATVGSPLEVLAVFGRLGLTSFGGPVAHLGYFRAEVVARRRWVDEATYADLVALCQFLPGPASSQTGIALGTLRAGLLGGLMAWVGFTLPSAVLMTLFALGVGLVGNTGGGWLHGLKIVAVAVVAQAVWGMARNLCPDRERATLAVVAAIVVLAWPLLGLPIALGQIGVIGLAGLVGWLLLPTPPVPAPPPATSRGRAARGQVILRVPISQTLAIGCWIAFFALLVALPLARQVVPDRTLALFDAFYRSGSLVFGGGHVVLPLLQAEVVPPGWVTNEQFLAGYGAAQAVPGPLFSFSSYLGALNDALPSPWLGAAIALIAIYLPSFLLVLGALPFWEILRGRPGAQAVLRGVNAGVVGLLLAALYDPVWTSAIVAPLDVALGLAAFALLVLWHLPPWVVVVLTALGGAILLR
ncbi:MAG: chromate efflux transporter [Chloroflexi bacterium]|nr:chromate efflux transporter [Chloroflexota bacterium]